MNKTLITLGLTLLFAWQQGLAQLSVTGEIRTRSTIDHGFMVPAKENENAEVAVDQRTRLNVFFKTDKYSTKIVLQDASVWGSDDQVTKAGAWGNTKSFGIYEAWIDLKLNNNSNLKIGRQEWSYDNVRILSWRNWATGALSFDGLLYQTKSSTNGLSLDIGLSYNNNGNAMNFVDNSTWQPDKLKTLNFLHAQKNISKSSYIAWLSMLTGKTDTANSAQLGTATHGLIAVLNKGKNANPGLFGSFESYYQHGTDLKRGTDGKYKNISAYMLLADIGYRSANKKLEISVGTEIISGHDYSNTDTDYKNTRHSFDLAYGSRVPFYGGYMNHFTVQDSYLGGTKGGGYIDPYIKLKYMFNPKNIIETTFFAPMLNSKVIAHTQIDPTSKKPMGIEKDASGATVFWDGNLGQYIDINYTRKLNKEMVIKAGLSYANVSDIKNQMAFGYKDAPSKTLHDLGSNYFGWIMISIKPTLFK